MKCSAHFLSIAILFPLFAPAQITGDTFKSAQQTKTGTITYVHNNTAGFAKVNSNGEVAGVLRDLMDEFRSYVQKAYGIELEMNLVEVEQANFSKFLSSVETAFGGVFGLSNVSITEARRERFLFSPPFIQNITVLVSNNSVPTLTALENINSQFGNLKAFSVTSSTYLAKLEKIKGNYYPGLQIELFDSGQKVMEELGNDKKAFAVVDLLYYLDFLQQGYPIKRHSVGDESGDEFGIIMPKSNDWAPVLFEFLDSGFMKSSKYRKIISDHLGKSAIRLIE